MDYVLKTNALCKKYKDYKAINGLSMNVPKGAIYGFIGKNGAGKTTLIRLICGLQTPSSGEYTLYGRKNKDKDIWKSRRRMGAIIETPSIYLDMTAEENLKIQYRILGLPSYDGLNDILKITGLEHTGKKKSEKLLSWYASEAWHSSRTGRRSRISSYWTNRSTDWIPRELSRYVNSY